MERLIVTTTQIALIAAFLALWQAAAALNLLDPKLVPSPSTVAATIAQLLVNADFIGNSSITIVRILVAFAIGAPLALVIGFILGENVAVGKSLGPIFNVFLSVPQSIFLPLFVLLLGLGVTEKVVFGMTHLFFVVAVNTMAAVRQVSHSYVVAARSFGAGRVRIYRSIYLRAMAPQVVSGLRFGMILNILGVLLAEMYASADGVGLMLSRWSEQFDVNHLMAATILISLATITVNEGMRLWETHVNQWALV